MGPLSSRPSGEGPGRARGWLVRARKSLPGEQVRRKERSRRRRHCTKPGGELLRAGMGAPEKPQWGAGGVFGSHPCPEPSPGHRDLSPRCVFLIERFSSARLHSQCVLAGRTAPELWPLSLGVPRGLSLGVPQGSGRRRAAAGSGRAAVWEHTSLLLALLLARWRTDSGLETERPGPGLLHVSLSPPPRRETGAVCRVRVRVCPCGRCTVPMCVCVLRVCAYVCEGVCVHVSVWETCFPPVCACLCVRVCAHVCESVHVCVCLCGRRAVPPRVCPCVSVCVVCVRVCPCVSVCVRAFPGRGRVRLLCLFRPECACPSVCLSLAQLHACSPRGQQR